ERIDPEARRIDVLVRSCRYLDRHSQCLAERRLHFKTAERDGMHCRRRQRARKREGKEGYGARETRAWSELPAGLSIALHGDCRENLKNLPRPGPSRI